MGKIYDLLGEAEKMIEKASEAERYIEDGVYDISSLDFVVITELNEEFPKVLKFAEKHKRFYVATPYETDGTILLSGKPLPLGEKSIKGTGFNYGSCNVITDCPKTIMILAEND